MIVDGHESHHVERADWQEFNEERIALAFLPAHCTHGLQILDTDFFAELKRRWHAKALETDSLDIRTVLPLFAGVWGSLTGTLAGATMMARWEARGYSADPTKLDLTRCCTPSNTQAQDRAEVQRELAEVAELPGRVAALRAQAAALREKATRYTQPAAKKKTLDQAAKADKDASGLDARNVFLRAKIDVYRRNAPHLLELVPSSIMGDAIRAAQAVRTAALSSVVQGARGGVPADRLETPRFRSTGGACVSTAQGFVASAAGYDVIEGREEKKRETQERQEQRSRATNLSPQTAHAKGAVPRCAC